MSVPVTTVTYSVQSGAIKQYISVSAQLSHHKLSPIPSTARHSLCPVLSSPHQTMYSDMLTSYYTTYLASYFSLNDIIPSLRLFNYDFNYRIPILYSHRTASLQEEDHQQFLPTQPTLCGLWNYSNDYYENWEMQTTTYLYIQRADRHKQFVGSYRNQITP